MCPGAPSPGHGHLNIALLVDEKVLGLQVPVDEVQGVQILKGQDDLRRVETGMGLAGGDKPGGDVSVNMTTSSSGPQVGVCAHRVRQPMAS